MTQDHSLPVYDQDPLYDSPLAHRPSYEQNHVFNDAGSREQDSAIRPTHPAGSAFKYQLIDQVNLSFPTSDWRRMNEQTVTFRSVKIVCIFMIIGWKRQNRWDVPFQIRVQKILQITCNSIKDQKALIKRERGSWSSPYDYIWNLSEIGYKVFCLLREFKSKLGL